MRGPGRWRTTRAGGPGQEGGRAAGTKWVNGAGEGGDDGQWGTSFGAHPNWIIPNSPDPISGQQRFMDAVVTVSKAMVA